MRISQLFKEGLYSRESLRRSELAVKQAQIELTQLRQERGNAEKAAAVQLQGLALEQRIARQGGGAGQAPPRPLDDQVRSRRRADVGAVAGRRAGAQGRRHRAHRRPVVVPRRRHRVGRARRPAAYRHAGHPPPQRRRPAGHRQRGLPDGRERRAAVHRDARPAVARGPAAEPARRRAGDHRAQGARRCA